MKIEVYGAGCAKCESLAALVKKVVGSMKVDAEVVHIGDMAKLIEGGIMMTPAIVIDGDIKCQGRTASAAEIKKWITEAKGK